MIFIVTLCTLWHLFDLFGGLQEYAYHEYQEYTCVCIYEYTHTHMYVYVCMNTHTSVRVCRYMHLCVDAFVVCLFVCMCGCMHVLM